MDSEKFIKVCRDLVADYTNKHSFPNDPDLKPVDIVHPDDVYVVWYSKTLQNHKALLGTHVHDDRYFECTYNGDKGELYFDAYKKEHNQCVVL